MEVPPKNKVPKKPRLAGSCRCRGRGPPQMTSVGLKKQKTGWLVEGLGGEGGGPEGLERLGVLVLYKLFKLFTSIAIG